MLVTLASMLMPYPGFVVAGHMWILACCPSVHAYLFLHVFTTSARVVYWSVPVFTTTSARVVYYSEVWICSFISFLYCTTCAFPLLHYLCFSLLPVGVDMLWCCEKGFWILESSSSSISSIDRANFLVPSSLPLTGKILFRWNPSYSKIHVIFLS